METGPASPRNSARSIGRPPKAGAASPFRDEEDLPDSQHLADPLIGRVIADRYRILEQIGRGATGVVYRAEHVRIGKLIALKLLSGELTQDGVQVARFKREALMASRLSHPNTVQVFDFGRTEGLVYLAMEYLRGEDLGRVIRREGALHVERTAKLVVQIANSLAEAHEKGIIHRDLKPENVLIVRSHSGDEVVKVVDFGLAKLRESSELSDLTSRGAIVGTPYYMSPEQIRGESVSPQSDVYALGALTYACLTGGTVFEAGTPLGVLTKHLLEEPVPPHLKDPELGIPKNVSQLVVSALAKDPAERPHGVLAFQRDFVAALLGEGQDQVERLLSEKVVHELTRDDAEAVTRDEVERYERKLKRRGRLALIAVALVACILLALVGVAVRELTARPRFDGYEREPNDVASQAVDVPFGTRVSGRIGKRIDRESSDRDFYRLSVPAETRAVRLLTTGLPNLAVCTWLYPAAATVPLGRYCAGSPGAELEVSQLSLAPGDYLVAVMQDRDAYTKAGAPPVYENVSDDYTLLLRPVIPSPEQELEPNDSVSQPSELRAPGQLIARLAFMRDVDVFCTRAARPLRFVVEDDPERPRPRESVLLATVRHGPEHDVPVRIHRTLKDLPKSPNDVASPWKSAEIAPSDGPVCLEVTLTPSPRAEWPLPTVAPASAVAYKVRVEVR